MMVDDAVDEPVIVDDVAGRASMNKDRPAVVTGNPLWVFLWKTL